MSWLVLVLVGTSLAGPRGKERQAAEERAAVDRQASQACAPATPEGYQIHTGFSSDPDEAEALEAAERSARRKALESLCAGKSDPRCAVLSRHLNSWKVPFYHRYTQQACSHVGIQRSWIDDDSRDQAQLANDLKGLARSVAEASGRRPLWIAPPIWSDSGCHAGTVGASLLAELRNGLAAAGGVRLASTPHRATRLQVQLSTNGARIVLEASLQEPGDASVIPVEGFGFPKDLFEIGEEGRDCRFDRELGLVAGARRGHDGRSVAISVSVIAGVSRLSSTPNTGSLALACGTSASTGSGIVQQRNAPSP